MGLLPGGPRASWSIALLRLPQAAGQIEMSQPFWLGRRSYVGGSKSKTAREFD